MAVYYKSSRGGEKMAFEGFRYNLKKERRYWRCEDRSCQGRAVGVGDTITPTKQHCHAPDETKTGIQVAQAAVKDAAATSVQPTSAILAQINAVLPPMVQAGLPRQATMSRMVQRRRQKELPPLPKSLAELDISCYAEDWLIMDCREDEDRVIVLSTNHNLQYLSAATVWFGDGTFDVAPTIFYQLYSIHAVVLRQSFPLVFAFASEEDEEGLPDVSLWCH